MSDSRLLLQLLMLDAGIVPDISLNQSLAGNDYDPFASWSPEPPTSLDDLLSSLKPAERIRVKRKFRKLWKKAEKAYGIDLSGSSQRWETANIKARRRAVVKRLLRDLSNKT